MPTTFAFRFAALTVIVGALVVGLLLDRPSNAQSQQDAPVAPAEDRYGIFDRPQTAQDDISAWRVADTAGLGLRAGSARLIATNPNREVAAVPAAKAPCLVIRSRAGMNISCATSTDQTPTAVSYTGSVGLVPNSVRAVRFEMSDGTSVTQPVKDNVWESPAEAAKVTFVLHGRVERIDLMPRSSLPKNATISKNGVVMGGTPPSGFGD